MIALSIVIFSGTVSAQFHTYIPESSLPQKPDQQGNPMFHTNIRLLVPNATQNSSGGQAAQPAELPPFPGYLIETPASLACIYGLAPRLDGCNPNLTTANPSGGSRAIALVDAFDDPTAVSDMATFTTQFGLPAADLTVVFANGARPGLDPTGGWELEEALDIEYSHAMAPQAQLFLVEAADNSLANLFGAVVVASNLVAAAGGGEVSMSWGGAEFPQETEVDSLMATRGVVYFASAGDGPGTIYPSTSPNVVSAGGTSLSSDLTTGNFLLENTWQDAGGGPSFYEPRPAFQNGVRFIVGNARGTPDLSFDSNPYSGVWIFDTNPNAGIQESALGTGWYAVGGTSVAAPSLAGIINAAGRFLPSSSAENALIYAHIGNPEDYNDIVYGDCGPYIAYFALPGYDLCTGVGSPKGLRGK
jgi:subtilase family serine protease